MTEHIVINPLTRISGFMQVDVTIENKVVVAAKTSGLLFRGFEKMLMGRQPFDAVYFTERICGICSTAHAVASSLALEDALSLVPDEQGKILRDIIHGCEFLQNHIRHFYQYTIPDFVRLPEGYPIYDNGHLDYRLPKAMNDQLAAHYFDSLEISRLGHEALTTFGGKAPHNHGVFIGGITTQPTTDKLLRLKAIFSKVSEFVENCMLPDALLIARYYSEYYKLGAGYGNLLSYGCFNDYKMLGNLYVEPLVSVNGSIDGFHSERITESIDSSWYAGSENIYKPDELMVNSDMQRKDAYTWIKAPRYCGIPMEVGPLARQWLSGSYRNGISMMDRTLARVYETKKIVGILTELQQQIVPGISVQRYLKLPKTAQGKGLVDTTRGALGHWVKMENNAISFYQIITPSVWNFASKDAAYRGTAEQALIGTPIQDTKNPVEIGRILRSFDPCVSCATHVMIQGSETTTLTIQVMP